MQGRINKLGLRQKFGKEEAVEALQAAEAVVKSERALGQVILSAGYNGEIKVHYSALNFVRLACCQLEFNAVFMLLLLDLLCTLVCGCRKNHS